MHLIKKLITSFLRKSGYNIVKIPAPSTNVDPEFLKIVDVTGFLSQDAFRLFKKLSGITLANPALRKLNVLEIGVYCGRSLLALGLIYKKNRVIGVDPLYDSFYNSPAFPEEAEYLTKHSRNRTADDRIALLNEKIHSLNLEETVELQRKTQEDFLESTKKNKYQLIYVDGEHSYKSINFFLDRIEKFFIKDSLLVIDDILSAGYPGISEAVHTHPTFQKTLIPVCYAFNKGVFIYKPSKASLKKTLTQIKSFAKTNQKIFRESGHDSSIVIFE